MDSHRMSRKRAMPEILDESRFKNSIYTKIIPEEILAVAEGQRSEAEAVQRMEERIKALIAGTYRERDLLSGRKIK